MIEDVWSRTPNCSVGGHIKGALVVWARRGPKERVIETYYPIPLLIQDDVVMAYKVKSLYLDTLFPLLLLPKLYTDLETVVCFHALQATRFAPSTRQTLR
jgi:hypothetical protein